MSDVGSRAGMRARHQPRETAAMKHLHSVPSVRTARRTASRTDAAVRSVVEAMECRRMLSAGDVDPTYGTDGTARSPFPELISFRAWGVDNRNGNTVIAGV